MATSGTNTFVVTRDSLIKSSLEDVGAIEYSATVPANLNTLGQEELNKVVASLQGVGVRLWSRDWTEGIALTSGIQDYTFSDIDILSIDGINIVENNVSFPCQVLDIDEFFSQIGKLDTTGRPNNCAVIPSFSSGELKFTLKFYPVPDDNYSFEVLTVRKLDEFSGSSDEPAFPSQWYDAIQYGLTNRLAPKFGVDIQKMSWFNKRYEEAIERAKKSTYTSSGQILKGAYSYQ